MRRKGFEEKAARLQTTTGPIIVCLDTAENVDLLTDCGVSLAKLWGAPLRLVVVVVLPPQLSLDAIPEGEEQRADGLLELASQRIQKLGLECNEEIWVTRNWKSAIEQTASEIAAMAVIVGKVPGHHWKLFGGSPTPATECPTIVVDGNDEALGQNWPPVWLLEANLNLGS